VLRPDADTHAERRVSDREANRRVFEGQRRDRIRRGEPCRDVWLDRANSGGPGVQQTGQARARSSPSVLEQNDRAESAADHAPDPELRGDRKGGGEAELAEAVSGQVHRPGRGAVGGGGSSSPAIKRTGDTTHSGARVRGVRQAGVCAPGWDFGIAFIQPAAASELSQGCGFHGDE
jgi:hypothetical protein